MVLFLYKSIVVFIVISPKWGLFGIINQIYHASVGILMECLPSGRHSIMIPTLAWHICIMYSTITKTPPLDETWNDSRAWMNVHCCGCCHAVVATISTLKLNFSPVHGSILMRFRSLEPPEFILLAIEFILLAMEYSLKSVAKCIFWDSLKS